MKIIHVDMDAFYASVEQRDRPELRGRPVAVGGDPGGRGVVAAASYEARRFGVRSAMPSREARRRCPDLLFVRPRMARYVEVSRSIREIFHHVTELVEPLSLDEAYLDVTENHLGEPSAARVAAWVKARIRDEVGLTASAGVGPSKLVAKIASDLDKPDGLVVIAPAEVDAFIAALPVDKLWGVGRRTAERLREMGLRTAADIRARPVGDLRQAFGKQGAFIHGLASGVDPRVVTPSREPKSKGAEQTFAEDVVDLTFLLDVLRTQAGRVAGSLAKIERRARTVVLKLRYADFKTITRSVTLRDGTASPEVIADAASELLLTETDAGRRPVRLIGVSASNLLGRGAPEQLPLPLPDLDG